MDPTQQSLSSWDAGGIPEEVRRNSDVMDSMVKKEIGTESSTMLVR
jgi:hypothetical protein